MTTSLSEIQFEALRQWIQAVAAYHMHLALHGSASIMSVNEAENAARDVFVLDPVDHI